MWPESASKSATSVWMELSPEHTQVLICDLQDEIVARSKTATPESIQASAEVLCGIAKLFSLPITLSVVPEGERPPKLISSLLSFASEENQKLRTSASPFTDAAAVARLKEQSRKTLILSGFATEVVVLHAALDAIHAGYGVIVAVDACGGQSQRTEEAALDQIRAAGGVVSSVVSVATKLSPDFTSEQGKAMFGIVQKLRLA